MELDIIKIKLLKNFPRMTVGWISAHVLLFVCSMLIYKNMFEPTFCLFRSIMLYFLIALLLFPITTITYNKCDSPLTLPSEFTGLSNNANNSSISLQCHLAYYSPVHRTPKAIALNQCHHHFLGPMTQHHHNRIGCMAHIPGDAQTFASQSQYHLITWRYDNLRSFVGSINQHHHNGTGRMTHILDDAQTFDSLTTWCHTVLHPVSLFQYGLDYFSGKREIQILNWNQIEFVFCSICSVDASCFSRITGGRILHKLKKRLSFYRDWDINHQIYIFMLNSHDVNHLIARILMKLQ